MTSPAPVAPAVPHLRHIWIMNALGELYCSPDPATRHRIKDPIALDHDCVRCHAQLQNSGQECGRLIYLLAGGLKNLSGEPLVLAAHVTVAEMRTMTREKMNRDQVLAFLGIHVSG